MMLPSTAATSQTAFKALLIKKHWDVLVNVRAIESSAIAVDVEKVSFIQFPIFVDNGASSDLGVCHITIMSALCSTLVFSSMNIDSVTYDQLCQRCLHSVLTSSVLNTNKMRTIRFRQLVRWMSNLYVFMCIKYFNSQEWKILNAGDRGYLNILRGIIAVNQNDAYFKANFTYFSRS